MKARKVVTRSGRGYRGYFPSKKLKRMVEWESLLERDFLVLLEFSPGVQAYREQPTKILYEHDYVTREYFPDFEVHLYSGDILHVEVKPQRKLIGNELQGKFKAISKHYEQHVATFKVLTEVAIRREPLFSNLQKLWRYRGKAGQDLMDEWDTFKRNLSSGSTYNLSQIAQKLGMQNTLMLLADQHLFCDFFIDLDSVVNFVRIPTEADYDALFF